MLYRLSGQRVSALIAGLVTEITARLLGKSQDAIQACLHRGLQRLSADPAIQVLATTGRNCRLSGEPDDGRFGC